MAVAPDFRLGIAAAGGGIVLRPGAVRGDAPGFAGVIGGILRLVAIGEVIAQREPQIAVAPLHDAATIMIAARQRTFLAEDQLDIVELRRLTVGEARARHRSAAAARRGLGEAEIDRLIRREVA